MSDQTFDKLVDIDFRTRSEFVDLIFDEINNHPHQKEIAFDLVGPITEIIENVLQESNKFSNYGNADESLFKIPKLDDFEVHNSEWTTLVKQLLRLTDIIKDHDLGKLNSIVIDWSTREFYLFRRLTWYAYSRYNLELNEILVNRIKLNPDVWLWDISYELNDRLKRLWDEIKSQKKQVLETVVLNGPSKDYLNKFEEDRRDRIKDEKIITILNIIADSSSGCSKKLNNEAEIITEKYEDIGLQPGKEIPPPFQVSSGRGRAVQVDRSYFEGKDENEIINALNDIEDQFDERLDAWLYFLKDKPKKAIDLIKKSDNPIIFNRTLSKLARIEDKDIEYLDLLTLIEEFPGEQLKQQPHGAARLLEESAEYYLESPSKYWKVWDRVFGIIEDYEFNYETDPYTAAINHPIGKLTEAVVNTSQVKEQKVGEGLISGAKDRLNLLLKEKQEAGYYILASQYSYLFQVDPDWSKENLNTLFDFKTDDRVAIGSWNAFLYSPFLNPSMWSNLKQYYYDICKEADSLVRVHRNLAYLLANVSLGRSGTLAPKESKRCLKEIKKYNHHVLERVRQFIPKEKSNITEFWKRELKSWLTNVWPKKLDFQTRHSSVEFIKIALKLESIFPQFIDKVIDLLIELERGHGLFKEIEEENIGRQYPDAVLKLLFKVMPEKPKKWFSYKNSITVILKKISETGYNSDNKGIYNKLEEVALANNL